MSPGLRLAAGAIGQRSRRLAAEGLSLQYTARLLGVAVDPGECAVNAFAAIDAMDEPLVAAPLFTIEPADKGLATEIQRQTTFLGMLRIAAPSVMAWAVPNGHNRGLKDRVKAKKEGLRAGVPDLTLCWNHGVAFLEFKDGKGKPAPAQVDLLNYLQAAGHRCAIVRTPEFALSLLAEWGAPIRSIR